MFNWIELVSISLPGGGMSRKRPSFTLMEQQQSLLWKAENQKIPFYLL